MSDRVSQLRRAYFDLHEQVLGAAPGADLRHLQQREMEIINELREFGVHSPYEPAALATGRAC